MEIEPSIEDQEIIEQINEHQQNQKLIFVGS